MIAEHWGFATLGRMEYPLARHRKILYGAAKTGERGNDHRVFTVTYWPS
jgi:hypothetical protein